MKTKTIIDPEKIRKQIDILTSDLIGCSLCIDQNYPSMKKEQGNVTKITVANANTTMFLKNIPYIDSYMELIKTRSYNMKFIDNGCILMQYSFQNAILTNARLAYYPNPEMLDFQNNQELYLDDELELYADVLEKNIVCVTIRFDYDIDHAVEVLHPASHLTLGQYENCRIPVTAPITPFEFVTFIVRNFYNSYYSHYENKLTKFKEQFATSIVDCERKIVHLHLPVQV